MAGVSSQDTNILRPFGNLPNQTASLFAQSQLDPLLRGLGLGGGAGFQRFENQLANAQGPLAGFLRQAQGFAPSVFPGFENAGQQVLAQGEPAYQQAQAQINQSLGAANQGLGYAQQFAQSAFSPVSSQPLFEEASSRLLDTLRPGLAARGLASSGAGQQAETDATRDLSFQVMQNQAAQQQAAVPLLGGAAQVGPGLAQQGLGNVGQLGQILSAPAQYGLQGLGSLLQLLSGGQQGALGLTQATAPQLGSSGKGVHTILS